MGSNAYDVTAGSDVIVLTAGLPRSPGMSRDDLVTTNEKIVGSVTEQVKAGSPDGILLVVSNPLDAMCHVAKHASGWPKERVFGMAGILDTARFSTFIAWETGSSVKDVTAMVLGGHGDQMVPVVSHTDVGGVPLTRLVAAGPAGGPPPLRTSTSMLPKASSVVSTSSCRCLGVVRSPRTASVPSRSASRTSVSRWRANMATFAPSPTSDSAIASPIPCDAPETIAVRPRRPSSTATPW